MRNAFLMAGLLVVAGCAQQSYPAPSSADTSNVYTQPKPVANIPVQTVTVEDDPFSKRITMIGIKEKVNYGGDLGETFEHLIRTWIDRDTGQVSHQLYVGSVYYSDGWKFWNRANSSDAEPLEFTRITQDVGGCSGRSRKCVHAEEFGLEINDADLRRSRDSGYRIKIYSKSGDDEILFVTREQIAKQLDMLDSKLFQGGRGSVNSVRPETPPETPVSAPRSLQTEPGYVGEGWVNPRNQNAPQPLAPQNNAGQGGVAYPAPVRQY